MCEDLFWLKDLFTLRDLLDLLILTLLFFVPLSFIVRYRGARVLWFLLLLMALWAVAAWLKLKTLQWLFDRLWIVLTFALIVIFQPELRRLVQQMAGRTILRRRLTKTKTLKRIIKAITHLSEKQIGALIVFERQIPVTNFTEGCVQLDALVSPELLVTIFYPLTPLHDGAAIIRENRIAAAACILPLAKEVSSEGKLGTRHRAAIGITQETDAVAVVVSEESGAISLAVNGRLYRNLTEEELKERLFKELGIEEES